ncbi:hypothetical protein COU58_01810 [Candidatus Pacearchaeota archaeon CG10_big_fil_rev_8_21_14_0_10_32_42]|nr:MAG: hypothetical protein COU58_01810 [Candidatus Pacearchaeota archaeon CG10_big_fil_rev_8_21_14_0_10_32_42]
MKIVGVKGRTYGFFLIIGLLLLAQGNFVSAFDYSQFEENISQIKETIFQELNSQERDFPTVFSLILSFYKSKLDMEGESKIAFAETRDFIKSLPLDGEEKNVFLGYFYSVFLWSSENLSLSEKESYYLELEKILEQDSFLKDFSSLENSSNLNSFLMNKIIENSSGKYFRGVYSKDLLLARISSQIGFLNHQIFKGSLSEEETFSYHSFLPLLYRSLLILEDFSILEEEVGFKLIQDSNFFSKNKFDLFFSLLGEYVSLGNSSNALALIDNFESLLKNYALERISEEEMDESWKYGILSFSKEIENYRSAISYGEFDRLKLDLLVRENKINLLEEKRKGYFEKMGSFPDETPEEILDKYALSVMIGGFGKDILNSINLFDETKEFLSKLKSESRDYYKGLSSIQILVGLGVKSELIKAWIEGDLSSGEMESFVNELLLRSNLQREVPLGEISLLGGQEGVAAPNLREGIVMGNNYLFYSSEQKEVFDFLKENKEFARKVYYSIDYGEHVKFLIGENKLNFNKESYLLVEHPVIYFSSKESLNTKLNDLEFGGVGGVLDEVDNMISPVYLFMTIATSGVSSATNFGTIAFRAASNLIIDSGSLATILVFDDVFGTDYKSSFIAGFATASIYQVAAMRTLSRIIVSGRGFEKIVDKVPSGPLNALGLQRKKIIMNSELDKYFSIRERSFLKGDYYGVLGVSRTSSEEEIRLAYRTKALEFHPDRNPNDPFANEKMQKINSAKDVLLDDSQRKNYDKLLDKHSKVVARSKKTVFFDEKGNLIDDSQKLSDYLSNLESSLESSHREIPLVFGIEEIKIPFGKELNIIDNLGNSKRAYFNQALPDGKIEVLYNGEKKILSLNLILDWNPELKGLVNAEKEGFFGQMKKKFDNLFSGRTSSGEAERILIEQSENRISFRKDLNSFTKNLEIKGEFIDYETNKVLRAKGGLGTASEFLARMGYVKKEGQVWLYWEGGVKRDEVSLFSGELANYKIHISADAESYDFVLIAMSKKIRELNVKHKISPGLFYSNPNSKSKQYGKIITVYTSNPRDVEKLILEAKRIHELYGAKGVGLQEASSLNSNLKYEVPIPETNNIIYYSFESLGEDYVDYSKRLLLMKKYWGQGPLDNLYWGEMPSNVLNGY